jgi:hypothetical protein
MVSTSITPEAMTLVDRPGALYKLCAIVLPLCGLAVAIWIAYQVLMPPTVAIDCSRTRGTCEIQAGSRTSSLKMSEIITAQVTFHRVSKVGTLQQLEIFAGGEIHVIGKRTSNEETTVELHRAALAISAFIKSGTPSLTLSWPQRVGFAETLRLVLTAATLLLCGLIMIGLWATRTIVVDRLGRRVSLSRSGPLRSRRTRAVSLDDVRELRQRTERDRTTIEIVIGDREVWPAITREPSSRPTLATARTHLEQAFGRAASAP